MSRTSTAISLYFRGDLTEHKEYFATQLTNLFGTELIVVEQDEIFVLVHPNDHYNPTHATENDRNCLLSIVLNNRCASRYFFDLISLCKEVFRENVLIEEGRWTINVRDPDDLVSYNVDTTPSYKSDNVRYNRACILSEQSNNDTRVLKSIRAQKCFNCLGAHNLRDCQRPRNIREIEKNKSLFNDAKSKKPSRYHLDDNQRKFGHFAPGVLSKNLRKALSLKEDRLPQHIYRMRVFGYPPGWLEEARISHSGMAVYLEQGRPEPIEGDEDGEILDNVPAHEYDVTKIVEFPGFNVPPTETTIDEYEKYNCPPMSKAQSKEQMLLELMPNAAKAYIKRIKNELSILESPKSSPASLSQSSSNSTEVETTASTQVVKDQGTPILASHSRYDKLPHREKFSHFISDIIHFENLPNSTGTYEKVSESIQKIREYSSKQNSK